MAEPLFCFQLEENYNKELSVGKFWTLLGNRSGISHFRNVFNNKGFWFFKKPSSIKV